MEENNCITKLDMYTIFFLMFNQFSLSNWQTKWIIEIHKFIASMNIKSFQFSKHYLF